MVGPPHGRKPAGRHVAGDAPPGGPVRLVKSVLRDARDLVFVAGRARLVRLLLEAIAAAGRVAVQAIELARRRTGTHAPRGHRVILAQVAAVGVEVRVVQGREIEVIEVAVAGDVGSGDRRHLRVAGAAGVVLLRRRHPLHADDLDVFRRLALGRGPADADVLLARTVAGLATDARLGPNGVIGAASQVEIPRELADVTAITRGVEGEGAVPPVQRGVVPFDEMPHAALGHVEPLLLMHVVADGQSLEPAPVQKSEEVVDILAAQRVGDSVFFFPVGGSLNDPAALVGQLWAVDRRADFHFAARFQKSLANFGVKGCMARPWREVAHNL